MQYAFPLLIIGLLIFCIGIVYLGLLSMDPAPSQVPGANFWLGFIPVGLIIMVIAGILMILAWTGVIPNSWDRLAT